MRDTEVLCVTEAASEPPKLEAIEIKTGKRRLVFDPNAGRRVALPRPELIVWSSGGRSYSGYLHPAKTGYGKSPLVITTYYCAGFLRGASAARFRNFS